MAVLRHWSGRASLPDRSASGGRAGAPTTLTPCGVLSTPPDTTGAGVEITVEIDPDGKVAVTISDETGYNPEVVDTICRQARETATATHLQLHGSSTS